MAPTTGDAQSQRTAVLLLPHQRGNADAGREKPAALTRVWSEADEVRILEALAEYTAKRGAPPERSQLHAALASRVLDKPEFTVTQIYEKVRGLRKRYQAMRSAGGGRNGDEVRRYQLSTQIWGKESAPVLTQAKPIVAKKEGANVVLLPGTQVRRGFQELQRLYPSLAAVVESIISLQNSDVQREVLKRAFEFIDDEEAVELDAKVKKHKVLEAKMTMSQTTLKNELLGTLIRSMD